MPEWELTNDWGGGTSLQGYIDVSYARLVEVFGEPNSDGDGEKVDAQWLLDIEGHTVTIYNYKDGYNYLGQEGTPVEEITQWHIGGNSNEVADFVHDIVNEAPVPEKSDVEILPEDKLRMRKTISQQKAKQQTYEALVRLRLPIPPDLKAEIESVR